MSKKVVILSSLELHWTSESEEKNKTTKSYFNLFVTTVNAEWVCLLDFSQINPKMESAQDEKGLLETN